MTSASPVSPEDLRSAMRRWATGVTVVTACHGGICHGMTASSFTSLSLDPPYVMVSLERTTRTHDLVRRAQAFGVTVLTAAQRDISERFANAQTEVGQRFEGLQTFSLATGSPFVKGGLVFLDCRVVASMDAGTQTVFVGEVVATAEGPDEPPLVYFHRDYRHLLPD